MRIVFMGTGEIAVPSLRWLLERGEGEVVGVFTQPDKPVGRKQILTPPQVKLIAEEAGVPVFQPDRLREKNDAIGTLRDLRPDLIIVMAYGQILPDEVIEAPTIATVNLHASLLPRHRGASPIQAAIREGDEESGITLMFVAAKLDAGNIILREAISLSDLETGQSLHDRLAELGPVILSQGLPVLGSGSIPSIPQEESLVTYAGKLEREDGRIDWTRSADAIERMIRAYDPWPGTSTDLRIDEAMRKLKLFPLVHLGPVSSAAPGTIAVEGSTLVVACGKGSLIVDGEVQLEGRRRMPLSDLLRGLEIPDGTILGQG